VDWLAFGSVLNMRDFGRHSPTTSTNRTLPKVAVRSHLPN
jgi:hypothetical protein